MTSELKPDFRSSQITLELISQIRRLVTRKWNIMEICGGQTHAILNYGLDQLLPPEITLIHGPGCPVCVTSQEIIEYGIQIARQPEVIFTSFGDMLRVPGNTQDLFGARAEGADVRVVSSPLDAVRLAQQNPGREVVFFAVGFETTVPAIAAAILHARRNHIPNISILPANVLVPPALRAILEDPENRVQGLLAAGHVCAVMGYWEYESLASTYHVPIVVTGFEPVDLANGILMTVKQLEQGHYFVENAYSRVVSRSGNVTAQAMMNQVFEPVNREWRGIGIIPCSGLDLRPEYQDYNALKKFDPQVVKQAPSTICIAGDVLRGKSTPHDCPAFGQLCTPSNPLGAPMVSTEGVCSAYFRYQRTKIQSDGH